MLTDYFEHVVAGAPLGYLAIAMHANVVCGVVHIVFVHHEHLAEVIGFSRLAQDLTLEVTQRGKVPARTAAVLVFHAGYRQLLYYRELLCLLCRHRHRHQGGSYQCQCLLHCLYAPYLYIVGAKLRKILRMIAMSQRKYVKNIMENLVDYIFLRIFAVNIHSLNK